MTSIEVETILPFRDIDDDELELTVNENYGGDSVYELHSKYANLNLRTFDHMEYKTHDFGNDIDPENNFFNLINNTCEYYTDIQFKEVKSEGALSIIHFNSRSLYKNFKKIENYISQFTKFNVLAMSETWLGKEKGYDVGMEGYELYTMDRTHSKSGGVALYVDSSLKCNLMPSMSTTVDGIMECLTVEIIVPDSKNIIITCIYRTPGSCIDTFNLKIDSMFTNINNKIHILTGDLNIDLLNPHGKAKIHDFINGMYSKGQFPIITKPSRITVDTATLIDHIYTNTIEGEITAGLLINDTTDHLPVFGIFQQLLKKNNNTQMHTQRLTRCRTPESVAALKADLSTHSWEEVYATENPDQAYDAFLTTLLESYNKHCPLKLSKPKKKVNQDNPWMTKGLENACKKKNTLYKLYMKNRTKEAESRYKTYKNKLMSIIRHKKKDYYHNELEQHRCNTQATWKILNSIIKKGHVSNNYPNHFIKDKVSINKTNEIANEFNNFFVNVGPTLANNIPEQSDSEGLNEIIIKQNPNSMFIKKVHEAEILEIVQQFKNKKSTDCTDIDMALVKEIINSIITPFTYICNQSFLNGVFPTGMKTSKVIPIFKNGDKHNFTNYRPISLLSQFSKILEKLFVLRLDNYIEKHNLLSNHQYGFRTNRSTSMAVMELVENISEAIDNNEYTIGVFIDLSKAFDTIHHGLLLKKMERYGIRGTANKWLMSYLTNRNQYVSINNIESEKRNITYGVPQGSVLGPKLFIMYINDKCEIIDNLNAILFADDTSLYCSGGNLEQLLVTVEKELKTLKKWFDINKLSLNVSKTKFIIFGNRKLSNQIKIKFADVEIEQVQDTKFLGITIDNKLNWKTHINNLRTKVSKTIAILYKMKPILDQKSLHLLYCSLVLPHISYCVEV